VSKAAHLMMVGARDEGSVKGDDFYASPPSAVHALCRVERFDGPIWEPACGDGAISRVLSEHGNDVVSTDLVERGFGRGHIDFLMEYTTMAPNIVTNPPYKIADQFAAHAVSLATSKVAFLMRLVWLAGQRRRRMFESTHLARVWVFSARIPRMHRHGYVGPTTTSTIDFAWFVWDRVHIGPPTIGWLSSAPSRDGAHDLGVSPRAAAGCPTGSFPPSTSPSGPLHPPMRDRAAAF